METNEVPEKIYVNFHFTETHPGRSPMVTKQGVNKYDVVYVRTDAFIEKACKWLEENIAEATGIDSYTITESFKQAMEK